MCSTSSDFHTSFWQATLSNYQNSCKTKQYRTEALKLWKTSTFVWLKFCCTAPNSEAKSAKSLWGGGGKRAWRNTYSLLKQRRSKRQNNVSQTCSAAHTWAISSHTTSVFIWHVACNCFLSSLLHNLIGNPYSSIIRASGNHKSGHNVSSTPKW